MIVHNKNTNSLEWLNDPATFDANIHIDMDYPSMYLKHWKELGIDYMKARMNVQNLVLNATNGFADFKDADKDAIGVFIGIDDATTLIGYYMSKGMTQTVAQGLHLNRLANNHVNERTAATLRASSEKITEAVIKYLVWTNADGTINRLQADNFTAATRDFINDFKNEGIIGTLYGDTRDGIMDYVESTGSYTSGGLLNYTFNPDLVTAYGTSDAVRLAMIAELKEIFVNGNY